MKIQGPDKVTGVGYWTTHYSDSAMNVYGCVSKELMHLHDEPNELPSIFKVTLIVEKISDIKELEN